LFDKVPDHRSNLVGQVFPKLLVAGVALQRAIRAEKCQACIKIVEEVFLGG
jgi:hypothetical protein